MTDQAPEHGAFDELAAGHALNALEPTDEQRFLRHAERCPRCRQSVADFRAVAAALAQTAPPAEPSPDLGARIRASVLADLARQDRPAARPGPAATVGPGIAGRDPGAPTREPGSAGDSAAGAGDSGTAPDSGSTAPDSGSTAPDSGGTARREPGHARVVPLRHRASRRWWKPAAAAAAVLIAVGGIWGGLAGTAGGPQPPLAVCAQPHACSQVVLTAAATHRVAAKVIVHDGVAWMQPAKMAANPADEIYVLWQITRADQVLPVGSFDVRPGASSPVRIGGLAAPYPGTRAFAVSLEHGRTIPPHPSKPVATGDVS